MSLFPKFKASTDSLATPATSATPPRKSSQSSRSSHPLGGQEQLSEQQPPLPQPVPSWPCPHCGNPAKIDGVFPSLDGERTLTMWSCKPCQVVAVTPDAIKKPPTVWVKTVKQ